ncbi:ATP-binding protein [Rhodopseudomonas sp. WA056]|nr:ATP-binding protein [Rhodopseudomonas sp. WA056]
MISTVYLKFGSNPDTPPHPIHAEPVNLFVGPNNSGKSRTLLEIYKYTTEGASSSNGLIIDKIAFEGRSPDEIRDNLSSILSEKQPNETIRPGGAIIASRGTRMQVDLKLLYEIPQKPNEQPDVFIQWYLRHFVIKLDGHNRINLINQSPGGDLQKNPQTTLQTLFRDNEKRKEVRRIGYEAFQSYFVVDPTNLGHLRIRYSPRAPYDEMEERNIHEAGVAFHSAAPPIEDASDGVKAFTGIIMELIAGNPHVLLIDEPEAFLHPSLAHKLGDEVSRAAVNSNKRVFASTHSPQFVMGCIQSGAPVNIIRLTYRSGVATARVLPSSEILELMKNPLLRSTGVLNGLFYENVVVTESDADRAFYQEINERLLRYKPEWGIPNCLFLNSQGKHTIQTIMAPLRRLGIPTAGIVDIDVLKDSGKQWSGILDGANIPEIARDALASLRTSVKSAIAATGKDMKRDGGINLLTEGDSNVARSLLNQLAEYGLFVVPGGELECWLANLGARGHGPPWLIDIFTKMGEDSKHPDYSKPTTGDVWQFLCNVRGWLIDPHRLGIPS